MLAEIVMAVLWAVICWYFCRFLWWLMTRKRKDCEGEELGLSSAVTDLLEAYTDIKSEAIRRGINKAAKDKELAQKAQDGEKR